MRLLTTHNRIKAADTRCKEIVEELKKLPPMEYCDEYQRLTTKGLNQEYLWSAQFIVNQCQYIIESDEWGYDTDFQWKMHKFQETYKQKLDHINNYSEGQ